MLNDLSLSAKLAEIKKDATQISTNVLLPNAMRIDKDGAYPIDNIKVIGENNLLNLGIPESKGGRSDDIFATILVLEEFAKGCASTAMSCLMHYSLLPFMSMLMSKEQEEKFLKPIIEGKWLGSASMSEPGTGSRLWHMNSYAVKNDKGEYIVDSFKSFCTSNNFNNFYLVPVKRTEDALSNDLIAFIVESTNKDIKVIGEWDGMGLRGTSSNPVHFNKCVVSDFNKLGGDKNVFPLLLSAILPIYLLGISTVYLGIAERAYLSSIEHVKKRFYTDKNEKGSELETVQRYAAEMRIQITGVRESIYQLAKKLSIFNVYLDELFHSDLLEESMKNIQSNELFLDLTQIKVAACEMAINVTNIAVQICGGAAYKRGHPVERCYRDARAGSIMGPSDDIMKVVIGKRIFGFPFPWES